jgi:hypothetical protein
MSKDKQRRESKKPKKSAIKAPAGTSVAPKPFVPEIKPAEKN